MSRLGVVKKVHRITLKTLNRVKHLKIHYQIKFHHIRCNSLADMASLPIPNSLSLVLYQNKNFDSNNFIPVDISNELGHDYGRDEQLVIKKDKVEVNEMHSMFRSLNLKQKEIFHETPLLHHSPHMGVS